MPVGIDTTTLLEKLISAYRQSHKPQEVDFRKMVPIANLDRATHFIHPYPAKLLQNIPIFFLNNKLLSMPGDVVYDPFSGSGTVMLESGLSGRKGFGDDINPFATLLAKVKCTPLCEHQIRNGFEQIKYKFTYSRNTEHDVVNSNYWYTERTKRELARLSNSLDVVENADVRDFLGICISAVAKKMSLADPRISVPVRINPDKYCDGHWLKRAAIKHIDGVMDNKVFDVFETVFEQNCTRMSALCQRRDFVTPDIRTQDARISPPTHERDKAQLIITSPPYPGAQKYIRACSLSLGWLKLCPSLNLPSLKQKTIGREEVSKLDYRGDFPITAAKKQLAEIYKKNQKRAAIAESYLYEMEEVFSSATKRLVHGGWLVLIAANNRFCGVEFMTQDYLVELASLHGLSLNLQLIDNIKSYGLMTKRNKTAGLIACEWVHIFQKD